MLSFINILAIVSLILAIILIIMCVIINVLINKEITRWIDYKSSTIIVESFEIYDKLLSENEDKHIEIERIKREYNEQYEAYKKHEYLKDELNKLMIKSEIFSFLSFLLSGICYMIKCNIV